MTCYDYIIPVVETEYVKLLYTGVLPDGYKAEREYNYCMIACFRPA